MRPRGGTDPGTSAPSFTVTSDLDSILLPNGSLFESLSGVFYALLSIPGVGKVCGPLLSLLPYALPLCHYKPYRPYRSFEVREVVD